MQRLKVSLILFCVISAVYVSSVSAGYLLFNPNDVTYGYGWYVATSYGLFIISGELTLWYGQSGQGEMYFGYLLAKEAMNEQVCIQYNDTPLSIGAHSILKMGTPGLCQ